MNGLIRFAAFLVVTSFATIATAQEPQAEPRERFTIMGGGGHRTLTDSSWVGSGGPTSMTDVKFAGSTGELTGYAWITKNAFVKGSIERGSLTPDRMIFNGQGTDALRYQRHQALIGWAFTYGSIAGGVDQVSFERNQAGPYSWSAWRTITRTEMFGPVLELNLGSTFGRFYVGEQFQYNPLMPGTFRLISGQDGLAPSLDQVQSGHNWSAFELAIKSELEIYRGVGLTMKWDISRRSETDVDTFPGQEVNRQKDSQRFMVGAIYRFEK
ncbi:MAG: hypothetical protein A2660_02710 [Candidatus Doudnabacteria bacterium RIFCSPHIGHO2_01_FULL_45_18]|uniref:Outer membrane protein beta-barrel domain-containing protein n=1 Tax=Candidatus Doudnabacteria bacterium RIFCSPHIGHO2_01_FULL_45_18 TaxID=1817823 RepID=A0A1F5NQX5_9BACT|nr:MAG: hypothetical protein A2660_02710 [Candidatus Doudnabacteria bacterium RIFCSPHIGHO2_01_FULL_45_18]